MYAGSLATPLYIMPVGRCTPSEIRSLFSPFLFPAGDSLTPFPTPRSLCLLQIYAPDEPQMHVINHLTGEEMDESRNALVETARIARGEQKRQLSHLGLGRCDVPNVARLIFPPAGDVKALKALDVSAYDALIIPGGFGAAKNLSDFAVKGSEAKVTPDGLRFVSLLLLRFQK